jgi:hypothetical protein
MERKRRRGGLDRCPAAFADLIGLRGKTEDDAAAAWNDLWAQAQDVGYAGVEIAGLAPE